MIRRGAPAIALALAALAAGSGSCGSSSDDGSAAATVTGSGGAGGSTTGTAGGGGLGGTGAAGGTGATGGGGEGGMGGGSPCPPDADGDEIPDDVEGKDRGTDTDADGTPDHLDLDSDGDSLPDLVEGQTASVGCQSPQDTDGDNTPDFQDEDSDDNGLPDADEVHPDGSPYDPGEPAPNPPDTDGDGIPDYADPDNDDDSLLDADELDAGQAVDTDGDGLPDLDDVDSDADTIGDAFEGSSDPDGDQIPAYRDLDSDGDGIDDTCEAGPGHMVKDPPPDTDSDSKYDFLDLDADGDGIPDAIEDPDGDCVVDPGETSASAADTDGDNADDLIETALGSDPADPIETPGKLGKFWFVLPYLQAPLPQENVVPLQTQLNQGDLAFIVDTTATMGGEIQNLKNGMSTLVQQLYSTIPDLAVGVAGFDDFPTGNYGAPGIDQPFYVAGASGHVSTSLANNLGAVLALNVHDGGDFPESHVAAMHRALTDTFLIWPAGSMPPTGAPGGRYGSLHFRDGALPILVAVTDAAFHNGRRALAPGTLHDTYSFNGTPPFPSPTIDDLITVMKGKGARFIGISASDGVRNGGDPYEDMAYLCDQSGSSVSPSAFGGTLCSTGLGGAALLPDGPATVQDPGGTCRLVFDITTGGVGISASVESGVQAVLKSIRMDLRALATPEPGPIDAVDSFVSTISVNASGGNDESEPGVPCFALNPVVQLTDIWSGPKGLVKVQDAVNETALDIIPTQKICFKVVAKQNDVVPQGPGPQIFKAVLTVKAKNGDAPVELLLGAPKEIAFIVPPSPQ